MTVRLRGPGGSLVVVVAAMLVVAACACAPAPRPGSGKFTMRVLTNDGTYSLGTSGGVVTVKNIRSRGGADTRVVVAEDGSPSGSSCATINPVRGGLTGFAQPGVALHIRSAGGRTTALTLTNNVVWGARWNWNVHFMDSGSWKSHTRLGTITAPRFYREGRAMPPLPWRVCARMVGSTLQGKVWSAGGREPTWGDANFGGSVVIPRGLAKGGESGVYAGHLDPGQLLKFAKIGH